MADIELVIKISEGLKKDFESEQWTALSCIEMKNALEKATPLPKEHGDLVDRDAINKELHRYTEAPYQYALKVFNESPTIIEANKPAPTKEKSEDKLGERQNVMKLTMNIYVLNAGNKGFDIKDEVFQRFDENDRQDLYDAIEGIDIEDDDKYEEVCDKLKSFVKESSLEKLEKYIEIDESSLEFDESETHEWGRKGGIAYSICVDFDIDKILSDNK